MTGQVKLAQRNEQEVKLYQDSYFEIETTDGDIFTEKEVNWSDISEEKMVEHIGHKRMVKICTLELKRITIHHKGDETTIEIKKGERVYQAIRSQILQYPTGKQTDNITGRTVGIVVGEEIREEHYIDALTKNILGFRL